MELAVPASVTPSQLAIATVLAQFNVPFGSKASAAFNNASQSAINPTSVVEPDTAAVPEHAGTVHSGRPKPLRKLLRAGGIHPVKLLPVSRRCFRLVRSPNSAGMVPLRERAWSWSVSTRAGDPASVTPSQLAIATVVAQFNVPFGSKASAAFNNASQSAINPTSVVEPDTAVVPEHAGTVHSGRPNPLRKLLRAGGIHPVKPLPVRPRFVRLVRLPNSAGIDPDKPLRDRSRVVRLVRLPNSAGMVPLRERAWSWSVSTRAGDPASVTPSQLAIATVLAQFNVPFGSKASAAFNNASQSAINPTSVVEPGTAAVPEHTDCAGTVHSGRPKPLRKLLRAGGIHPVKLLPVRPRVVRLVRLPNSAGIDPDKPLPDRSRVVRLVRLPNSAGMVPLRERAWSWSVSTRAGDPASVTPSQLAIATVLAQFNVPFGSEASAAFNNASQSAINPTSVVEPDTAVVPEHAGTVHSGRPNPLRKLLRAGGIHPVKPLPYSHRFVRLVRLPNSAGIDPDKPLPDRSRVVRLVRLPNSAGIDPDKPLPDSNRVVRLVRLPNSAGIDPDKPLPYSHRVVRLVRLPNSAGIDPDKPLTDRSRVVRLVRLPNSAGIDPDKTLKVRPRVVRLVRLPNSAGIDPDKPLLFSRRVVRLVRSPNSAGIDPDKPL